MIVLYRHTILRVALALVVALTGFAMTPVRASAATADAYETDNTWQTARDVGAIVGTSGDTGYYGEPMGVQSRTFHFVDDATATSDEDWVRFTVSATDIDTGLSYIFEAAPSSAAVRPVIEIYGPGSANPTAPGDLPVSAADPTLTAIDPNAIQPGGTLAYNGGWSGNDSASVSFIPPTSGTYYVRVRPYYQHESGTDPGFGDGVGSYQLRMKAGQLSRLFGADRIATAVAVSRERYPATGPDSKACIIASGFAFPDALAGSTLAGAVDGPLLLTARDSLPSAVAAELKRLGITQVYLLGGTAAVTDGVRNSILALGISVKRVSGATRYATAHQIALEAARHTTPARLAFVVNSLNFPDALAASPMATHNVAPILLTGSATLDGYAEAALKDPALGITDVVIVGGTSVVSANVQNRIATVLGGTSRVRRIAGASRYETASKFAVWATAKQSTPVRVGTSANPAALESLDFARIGVASGENFPDALAGGVFCGAARSPVLLTPVNSVSPWLCADFDFNSPPKVTRGMDYWYASNLAILRGYVFGGTVALSRSVFLPLDMWTGPGPSTN